VQVRVRFFGPAAQTAGRAELKIELPERATVGDAVEAARRRLPGLRAWLNGTTRFAVGTRYVPLSTALGPDDEVSVIPPVGGG
jgi:molybdopterin converting factor small subunit